jgi:hypothetical protein
MKRGKGIKRRDDRSIGNEILMTDAFVRIKPTEPLRLARQVARRKRNLSDSSGNSLARQMFHAEHAGKALLRRAL